MMPKNPRESAEENSPARACAGAAMETTAQIKLTQPRGTTLINMGVAALVIAGLYFGREVFVPVALAVLLSFVLAPFVSRLQSLRLPRVAAVIAVVILGFAIIFSLGGLMVTQASRLAEALPGYEHTLRSKIESLRGLTGGGTGTLQRASDVLNDLKTELQNTKAGSPTSSTVLQQSVDSKPIPVEVRQPDPGALNTLVAIIAPLVSPLTTTGIVVIFVIFILLQRQDLRNRFIRLAGSADIQRTTAALDEAGDRLSRLFLTQIAFNAGFGVAIGVGLQLIGVPSAPLWGLIAMIMRFVPYIGAFISAIFPLILAAAVGTGWEMLLLTAILFVVLELLAGQVLEPVIFGHSSGLSPVAIIVAASFWTWLWGPVGLVLATPLTMSCGRGTARRPIAVSRHHAGQSAGVDAVATDLSEAAGRGSDRGCGAGSCVSQDRAPRELLRLHTDRWAWTGCSRRPARPSRCRAARPYNVHGARTRRRPGWTRRHRSP
ncbi:MAG TPA: AI-2E family transporter [Roseiarcus sp.]